jgi:hypothetical protein
MQAEYAVCRNCSCAEIISQMASERAMKAAVSHYDAGIEALVGLQRKDGWIYMPCITAVAKRSSATQLL